jgi:predicted transcriptional regulator
MRTTIRLNDELLQTAKQHALATQRTLTQLIQDALVSLLEKERGAASPRTVKLPTFQGDGIYPGIDINSNASLRDRMELSE